LAEEVECGRDCALPRHEIDVQIVVASSTQRQSLLLPRRRPDSSRLSIEAVVLLITHRNRLRHERLEVLRRPPNHLKKARNELRMIMRDPLEVRRSRTGGAGTTAAAFFFARGFAGFVGLLDFAGALVVRFFAATVLARFLAAFFAGALFVRFFVAFFAGVRFFAMAPPRSGTLSETLLRASSGDAPSARGRRQTRVAQVARAA